MGEDRRRGETGEDRRRGETGEDKSREETGVVTFRQLGWMISLQMVHSIRERLNFSSADSTVSSFPASPHAKHTAV